MTISLNTPVGAKVRCLKDFPTINGTIEKGEVCVLEAWDDFEFSIVYKRIIRVRGAWVIPVHDAWEVVDERDNT